MVQVDNPHRPRGNRWSSAGDVLQGWARRAGVEAERMLILNQVWERVAGPFSRHWTLSGVRRGTLYVKPRSAAAGHELQLRGSGLIKSLNKYFKRSWIKAIRTSPR